jgi:hypothetical protein
VPHGAAGRRGRSFDRQPEKEPRMRIVAYMIVLATGRLLGAGGRLVPRAA